METEKPNKQQLLMYRVGALIVISGSVPLVISLFLAFVTPGLDVDAVRVLRVFLISYVIVTLPYAWYYGTQFAYKRFEKVGGGKL